MKQIIHLTNYTLSDYLIRRKNYKIVKKKAPDSDKILFSYRQYPIHEISIHRT